MDPELLKARERLETARMAHYNAYLMNSQGQTIERLVEIDLALRRVDQELMEALLVYRNALDKEAKQRQEAEHP